MGIEVFDLMWFRWLMVVAGTWYSIRFIVSIVHWINSVAQVNRQSAETLRAQDQRQQEAWDQIKPRVGPDQQVAPAEGQAFFGQGGIKNE